jgi:hypothetical protein
VSNTGLRGANPQVVKAILGLGVVALVVVVAIFYLQAQQPSKGGDPSNNVPALAATKTFDYVGGDHTSDPVTYTETPPAGGPHDPTWDDCGVYTEQPRNENVVHDLEHGTVWVTYRPGLSQADISSLETALGTVKSEKTILSPYPGLPSPVVVTVWNAQLHLTGADDSRLQEFLTFYGDGHTAPEAATATCKGGAHVMASSDNP